MEYKGEYIKISEVKSEKLEAVLLLNLIKRLDGDDDLIRYLYSIASSAKCNTQK